jgi:splicing factor 3B subunit 3
MRTVIDNVTGMISDTRSKFLGNSGVKLQKIVIQNQSALIALSTKPWLCYKFMGKYNITPMSYDQISSAATFSSEKCPDGIATIKDKTLKIIAPERLGESFTQQVLPLTYTPRKISIHPYTNYLVINEMEVNCLTSAEREQVKKEIAHVSGDKE